VQLDVNVNKQYLSTRKSCNKGDDGCAMRVVFSKPQNCPGFNDGAAKILATPLHLFVSVCLFIHAKKTEKY